MSDSMIPPRVQKVLDAVAKLQGDEPVTKRTISKHLCINGNTASSYLNILVEKNYVKFENGGYLITG